MHRKHVISRILGWAFVVLLLLVVVLVGSVLLMVRHGGKSLQNKTQGAAPNLGLETPQPETAAVPDETEEPGKEQEPAVVWEPDWVQYNGKVYDYKENIMTFLVMGIDKDSEVKETEGAEGGQSDALFLVVVNPDEEKVDLIAINRDTMTDIYLYGYENAKGETPIVTAQITTQHGFGDGKELSCQYTCDAVSSLFYDLPLNGYLALNMAAIPAVNDAVGGVDVVVLEDLTKRNPKWTQGASVHLEGMDSFYYVKWRDTTVYESARGRLERQKQYLKAFIAKAKEAIKSDLMLPVTLYNELSKYMVTDLSVDEVAYMASSWGGYSFGTIYTMEGETMMGLEHEEFYPDYDALRELVLEVFYDEIEP